MSSSLRSTPPRFVIDLRPPAPPPSMKQPPMEPPVDSHLKGQLEELQESQKAMLNHLAALTKRLQSPGGTASRKPSRDAELERLREENRAALELVVTLGQSFARASPDSRKGLNVERVAVPSNGHAGKKVQVTKPRPPLSPPRTPGSTSSAPRPLPHAHRDRISEYYRSLSPGGPQ